MSIHIYTGLPGSGKTFAVTMIALKYLKQNRDVYCNYDIKWNGANFHKFNSPSDLFNIQKGIIILDEAQVYFNSRQWQNLPIQWQLFLQQHRHDGLDIYGTTQNIGRIDTVFRNLISNFYVCKNLYNKIVRITEYEPDHADRKRREQLSRKWVLLTKKRFALYDTRQKIAPPTHLDKRCPTCFQFLTSKRKPRGRGFQLHALDPTKI